MAATDSLSPRPGRAGRDANELRDIASDLADARENIETAFVDACERLTLCTTLLLRITRVFEALPADLATPLLAEAPIRLAAVGDAAELALRELSAIEHGAARIEATVKATGHQVASLEVSVRMIGIVAINAKVAALGVVDEAAGFDALAAELASLANRAVATTGALVSSHETVAGSALKTASRAADFALSYREPLAGVAAGLRAGIARVTAHQKVARDGMAEAGPASKRVGMRICETVMAMQVGDATRQRIEHVEMALELLADLMDDIVADLPLSSDEMPAAIVDVCELEAAQLRAAMENFDSEVDAVHDSLLELAAEASTAVARSQTSHDFGDPRAILGPLGKDLHDTLRLVGASQTGRRRLEPPANIIGAQLDALRRQFDDMRQVEAELDRLGALAAQRSAELGDRGWALDVVALQLRELTVDVAAATDEGGSRIAEACAETLRLGRLTGSIMPDELLRLDAEAVAALRLLEAADARLAAAVAVLNSDGPRAAVLLGEAAADFYVRAACSEAMADASFRVTALGGAPPAEQPAESTGPLLERLFHSYTMEAERRTHMRFVSGDEAGPELPPTPGESSTEELLF